MVKIGDVNNLMEGQQLTLTPPKTNGATPASFGEGVFKKAIKYQAKGRVALIGPAGSGKSWTMLTLARALVGPKGKIAAIDTEHGSLSKYADLFDFDVMELTSFSPEAFLRLLKSAEDAGYDAFCCDSLSHFWVGKDGALEFVDMASKRHKDNMGGWKEFRPHERAMVDAMIASPLHVLTTMRTKTEYQEQVNPNTGKKQRVKIGLAPVQREGLEYEFDLIGYMDEENTMIVDKTRCPAYSKKAITQPGTKDFEPFVEWLKGKPTQTTVAEKATSSADPVISKDEMTTIVSSCKEYGVTESELMAYLKTTHGIDARPQITLPMYTSIIEWIMRTGLAKRNAPKEDVPF